MNHNQQGLLYQHQPPPPPTGKRSADPRIRLTQRDTALLYELLSARYLTTPQVEALFWRGSKGGSERGKRNACQRRLLQLTRSRLIRRIEVPVRREEAPKPYIYTLGKAGAEILASGLGISLKEIAWQPKSDEANFPFLAHLLATNDLRITLRQACEQPHVGLVTWVNEKELKSEGMKDYVTLVNPEGKSQRAAVVPDAYCALQVGTRIGHLFLEIDLGTVTIEPNAWERRGWARKVRAYCAYRESGQFLGRYGASVFRVLCITTGDSRLRSMKATTKRVNGGKMFWFSTFERLAPESILTEPVWERAGSEQRLAFVT